ncbi:hypothetical protein BDN72DRAFT_764159 [Pluteus cervinus]|uniref:Uncharacterized protein n=1 Tax=Pluteus cervinus TaxID=181527 RepID=A0ACD3B2T9_9AGAR|nr:hypothetical protein BDN72DRAFT_764159 [Pluteus cervinus]
MGSTLSFASLIALKTIGRRMAETEELRDVYEPQVIEAWPAIFKWTAYFFVAHVQNKSLDIDYPGMSGLMSSAIVQSWLDLCCSPKIQEIVVATRGSIEIAALLWLMEDSFLGTPSWSLPCASTLLTKLVNTTRTAELRDRVLAAVGDIDTVTKTALMRLKRATAQRRFVGDLAYFSYLAIVYDLSIDEHPIEAAFLEMDTIQAMTRGLRLIAAEINVDTGSLESKRNLLNGIIAGFMYLSNSLESGTGPADVIQSINAGLIEAFVECSPYYEHIPANNWISIELIFNIVVPKYLVYSSLIRAVSESICRLQGTPRLRNLRNTVAWKPFQKLCKLALERLLIKRYAKNTSDLCDNLKCEQHKLKKDFLTCGSCHTACYCSAACQKVAWKSGHRDECENFRHEYLTKLPEANVKRDKTFMDLLVTYYAGNELPRLRESTRKDYPDVPLSAFLLIIDFRDVPPSFTLRPPDSPDSDGEGKPEPEPPIVKDGGTPVGCFLPSGKHKKGFVTHGTSAVLHLWDDPRGREPFGLYTGDSNDGTLVLLNELQKICPKFQRSGKT